MTIDIRIAKPEDAAPACEMLRRAIAETCVEDHRNDAAILEAWLGNKTPENVQCWFGSCAQFSLVAEVDGAIGGVAIVQRTGKIVLFYVCPSLCGSGVGKTLLEAVEAHAAKSGLATLHVASTATARPFYARHGFAETGGCATAPFGVPTVCMSKPVDPSLARKGICRCSAAPA
ncbi:GNAT family N-acetyltransferase [Oxalobacteraceae bacterium OM1]|nr:GNAT family N-acetyltransferase [Oxalobacteraceae bacterium OM1]